MRACSSVAARWLGAVVLLLSIAPAGAIAREKTDVIAFVNGDRLTGEILSLEYGRLTVKTDSMGTVGIEWPSVASVTSRFPYLVERLDGGKYYGTLSAEGGKLALGDDGTAIPLADVARVSPAEDEFLSRIDGSLSAGISYTKSSDIKVSSFRYTSTYQSQKHQARLEASNDLTSSPETGTSQRLRVAYGHRFLRPGTRFWFGTGSFESNDELGLDGRLQLGAGAGQSFRRTSDSDLVGFVGLVANQEWVDSGDDQASLEGVLGVDWRIFRFASPETALVASFSLYPSLTEQERVRSRTDVTLKRDLIRDFDLELSFYHEYDTRPPAEGAAKSDHGITTSIAYTF